MLPSFIRKYFQWLQADVPTGTLEKYPQQDSNGETNLKNVFIVGDLTGIPLLKLAIERSSRQAKKIFSEKNFLSQKELNIKNQGAENFFDVVIIGAGPAGIAVAREAQKKNLKYIIVEASENPFETIRNFPKGKPMIYAPTQEKQKAEIILQGSKKEDLLKYLDKKVQEFSLHLQTSTRVEKIESKADIQIITLATPDGEKTIKTLCTFLAIGKSGNARKIGIQGENLPKVFNTLYDASEFKDQKILVVGGGDSALESAIDLSKQNFVTLSYRQKELARAKPENINTLHKLAKEKKISLLLGTNLKKITQETVEFKESIPSIENDIVFTLIGKQMPYAFFKKCGIALENTWSKSKTLWLIFSLSFANTVYFGKLSSSLPENFFTQKSSFWDTIFMQDSNIIFSQSIAWLSFGIFIFSSIFVFFDILKNFKTYFRTKWHFIKWGYIIFAVLLFLWAFLGSKYLGENLLLFPNFELWGVKGFGGDPYFWYGFLYTTSIGFFGIRRIITSKTEYVRRQTIILFLIQALPLFFIPNFILPWLNHFEIIPETIKQTVFLGEEWWRFVGFILAWPLFIWNIFTDEPSLFWLITSIIQTFVIIPYIVIKWGKGGYCSWICSCGAMAETVGDEYRHLAPHGKFWKKMELIGQWILFAIIIVTLLHIANWFSVPEYIQTLSKNATLAYKLLVDTFLAGTIGVGLYFFFSGRVWCRFMCPLAAFMNIIQKWGEYRIFADKKKCISCGICTKVCHMGIDVMSYAQKGKPMDDVQCVRCSACVRECPMGVLSFGRFKSFWGSSMKSENKTTIIFDTVKSRK